MGSAFAHGLLHVLHTWQEFSQVAASLVCACAAVFALGLGALLLAAASPSSAAAAARIRARQTVRLAARARASTARLDAFCPGCVAEPVLLRDGDGMGERCVVCIEGIGKAERVRALVCGHIYHAKCIENWYGRRNNRCPLCAEWIVPPGVHNASRV
jgi:hypothetical protein